MAGISKLFGIGDKIDKAGVEDLLNLSDIEEEAATTDIPAVSIEEEPAKVKEAPPKTFKPLTKTRPQTDKMTDAQQKLLADFLAEVNGQDTYDARTVAVGKLSTDHYLRVPTGLDPFSVLAEEVGTAKCAAQISGDVYAQIYALNKDVFEGDDTKIKGALLRTELVRNGWYTGSYEVKQVAAPVDAIKTFTDDLPKIQEYIEDAKLLALLLPLAAEHTFRTMGHHWLTGMMAEYSAKYQRFFAACVMPGLTQYLAPDLLYHRVAHWVSLPFALAVARSSRNTELLPNAVVVRSTAAPAGTALVTTSAAVLESMATFGVGKQLNSLEDVNVEPIMKMAELVKEKPGAYHTIPMAYSHGALSDAEASKLEEAKREAAKIAPILQGYVDSLPRTSDLSAARALAKHADSNPMLRKRAKVFFREIGITKAANIRQLIDMDKRSEEATAGESTTENEA